jgi:hypothetical protein
MDVRECIVSRTNENTAALSKDATTLEPDKVTVEPGRSPTGDQTLLDDTSTI